MGAQRALEEANAREESRKAELDKQLKQLQKEQSAVQKPEQVLNALPDVLPLPTPLVLGDAGSSPTQPLRSGTGNGSNGAPPDAAKAAAGTQKAVVGGRGENAAALSQGVRLPAEDLKPLYDFALECKACQDKLAAAQADLKDEKSKTQALSRERDDALRAARGGSVIQRVARAAKWFAIGAAAGAVAVKMAR